MGVVLPKSSFNIVGRPQAVADYSTTRGVRVSGTGLTNFWAIQASTGTGLFTEPGFSALGPTGRINTWYVPLIPTNVDPRLGTLASTFQFFSFRSLTLTYVPACGTNTVNSIAFGVAQDAELFLRFPQPSQQQILEVNSAVLTPFWQTASVTYNHSGTKLWNTALPDSGETGIANDFYQGQMMGAANQAAEVGVRGYFFVTYVLDLYEPVPVNVQLTGVLNPASGYIGPPPCCRRPHHSDDEKDDELPDKLPELVRS